MKQRFKKLRNGFQHKNLRSKKVTNKTKVEVMKNFSAKLIFQLNFTNMNLMINYYRMSFRYSWLNLYKLRKKFPYFQKHKLQIYNV